MTPPQPQKPIPNHQDDAALPASDPNIHSEHSIQPGGLPSANTDSSLSSNLPDYLSWPPWDEGVGPFHSTTAFHPGHSHSSSGASGSPNFGQSVNLNTQMSPSFESESFCLHANDLANASFQSPPLTSISELETKSDTPEDLQSPPSQDISLQRPVNLLRPRKDDLKQTSRTNSERAKTTRERISFGRQRRSVKEQLLKALEDIERKNEENSQLQCEIAALRREVEIYKELMPLRERGGGFR